MPDTPGKRKPTIDERLEAITQTLEVSVAMQQANERAIAELGAKVDALTTNVSTMHDSISMLGRIAGLRQEKLDQHDGEIESLTTIIERLQKRRGNGSHPTGKTEALASAPASLRQARAAVPAG
jgi:chromosome segregation ATPase